MRNCPLLQNATLTLIDRLPHSPAASCIPYPVKFNHNVKLSMSEYLPANLVAGNMARRPFSQTW